MTILVSLDWVRAAAAALALALALGPILRCRTGLRPLPVRARSRR